MFHIPFPSIVGVAVGIALLFSWGFLFYKVISYLGERRKRCEPVLK
jgi:hypothetical protein